MTLAHKGEHVDAIPEHTYKVNWEMVDEGITVIGCKILADNWLPDKILYISRGGRNPAYRLRDYLKLRTGQFIQVDNIQLYRFYSKVKVKMPYRLQLHKRYLIVDDIHDTGKTYKAIIDSLPDDVVVKFAFLYIRTPDKLSYYEKQDMYYGNVCEDSRWLIFPWEIERDQS